MFILCVLGEGIGWELLFGYGCEIWLFCMDVDFEVRSDSALDNWLVGNIFLSYKLSTILFR